MYQIDYTKKSQYKIEIVWGLDDGVTDEYYFESEKEMTAFVDGVNEAVGFHDCVICGDGYEYSSAEEYIKDMNDE